MTRLKILPGQMPPRRGAALIMCTNKPSCISIFGYCDHGNQNGYITGKNKIGKCVSFFSNLPQSAHIMRTQEAS